MSSFNITTDAGRLSARLEGDLSKESAASFRDDVVAALPGLGAEPTVIVDLTALTNCGAFARSELIKMQASLRAASARTAYIADVSRFRGLALWVINLSEDENAKACMNSDLAERWLSSKVSRIEEIKARTQRSIDALKAAQRGGK